MGLIIRKARQIKNRAKEDVRVPTMFRALECLKRGDKRTKRKGGCG